MPVDQRSALAVEQLARAEAALRAGRQGEAADALKAAVGTSGSHAVAQRASALIAQLDANAVGLSPMRVAFLSDHNVGPLPRLLSAQGVLAGLRVDAYVPDFDAWLDELVGAHSGLRAFSPDVVVLDVRLSRLAQPLVERFLSLDDAAIDDQLRSAERTIVGALDALRTWSQAAALVHAFARPRFPALGLYDTISPRGQVASVSLLNTRIQDAARSRDKVFVIDPDQLALEEGGEPFLDERMFALAKVPYTSSALSRLALEYAKYLRALVGRTKKVLVLDADNTLWGGIVGEDGVDGIQLNEDSRARGYLDLQRSVAELGRRGVVLALNTANERADVDEVLAKRPEMILHERDFAVIVANWKDKAENLVDISRELDLALDSFVFADDDPVQCARIRTALPDVAVVELVGEPLGFAATLARPGWFDSLTLTQEDRRRNELYRADASRLRLQRVAASSEDFIASLHVTLHFSKLGLGGLARAASLTQRTNQFNLTTRRYTEVDLRALLSDPAWTCFTVRLVDRFGDIGVIGLAMLRREMHTVTIETFVLSCRALRRQVEDAMLSVAVEHGLKGASEVIGVRVPSARNAQTATFYPDRGFDAHSSAEGEQRWRRSAPLTPPPAVTILFEGEGWS